MMQLVNSNGAVLLERGKPHTQRTHTSTLHVRSMSKGMKKTVKPVLMSKDVIVFGDFLITNGDGKTTFQFRTPSEGGVELLVRNYSTNHLQTQPLNNGERDLYGTARRTYRKENRQ